MSAFRNISLFAAGIVCGIVISRLGERAERPAAENPRRVLPSSTAHASSPRPRAQGELSAARDRIAELELELYGTPTSWPNDTPYLADPENYAREFARALDECHIPVDVLGYDCSEPPCYAILRRDESSFSGSDTWWSTMNDCPYWQQRYARGVGIATDSIDCEDGHQEGFTMLALSPVDDPEWLMNGETDRSMLENFNKRFELRKRAAREAWPCRDE